MRFAKAFRDQGPLASYYCWHSIITPISSCRDYRGQHKISWGYVQALVRVHEQVIPHLSNSHLLADLMTGALDSGGLLGMLALHAIFVLVTKYGLEYPHFYARLYQLLQPDTLLVSPYQSLYHGSLSAALFFCSCNDLYIQFAKSWLSQSEESKTQPHYSPMLISSCSWVKGFRV